MTGTTRRLICGLALASLAALPACKDATLPTTPTPTTTDLFFISQVMQGGTTTRSFKATKAGDLKVLFTSLLPESAAVVNVSIGTWDGTRCTPTTTVQSAAGSTTAIITTTVAVGEFCASVSDAGSLTKTNDFSMTITIPAGP